MKRFYIDDKVVAIGAPRFQFGDKRDFEHENACAKIVYSYGNRIRVHWNGKDKPEDGWREAEDFKLVD